MPELYPLHVEVNQKSIDKVIALFKQSYKEIVNEIATATDFGVANRKAILAQIESKLESLGENVQEWVEKELPEYYKSGASDAIKQLKNINADIKVSTGFNIVHKEAVAALVDDTMQYVAESLTGVKRDATRLLGKAVREQVTQKIATGQITGAALKEVAKTIKATLQEQGLASMVDKKGRRWQLDNYAKMLFRTKAVESRNVGLINRMAENDYDLVQVSQHQGSCPLCSPWEGKVLSITGKTKGYPTYRDAVDGGLFHPNCRHAINTMIPSLASKTKAYDPTKKTLPLKKAVKKQDFVSVGGKKFEVSSGEASLLNKRDMKFETHSRKQAYGSYQRGFRKISIKKSHLSDKGFPKTAMHEIGHFIDFEINNPYELRKPLKQVRKDALSSQKEFAKVYKENGFNVAVRRITTDRLESKSNVIIKDFKMYTGGFRVDLFDKKTNKKISSITMSKKYRKYVLSKKEIFADAYGQYRTNPTLFKKDAPKMFSYFDDLFKNKIEKG